MPKRLTTEDHLATLRQLRAAPPSPETIAALEQLLAAPLLHGIILKSIATLAEQADAKSLTPHLVKADLALIGADALKRDPGCEAKVAIVRTLLAWDANTPELYRALSTYRQPTPGFGDPVDVAAELRGLSAIGIATTRPPDAILRLVDLLVDDEKLTRAGAATALGLWRGPEVLPLLRLKAHLGDDDPETLTEIFGALLKHDPKNHLLFVAHFLNDGKPPVLEAAALALGQSKLPAALAPLTAAYATQRQSLIATTLILAISLLRSDESIDWLLAQLPRAKPREALSLLDALRIYDSDPKTMTRIRALIVAHPSLQPAYAEVFKE